LGIDDPFWRKQILLSIATQNWAMGCISITFYYSILALILFMDIDI
jgi:hypothetical protein